MLPTQQSFFKKTTLKRPFLLTFLIVFFNFTPKTRIMQITFPILLVKKIFSTKKEFFFYELNKSNEVINYTLTNDPSRHLKKFNNNFCLVSDLKIKFDEQLHVDSSETDNAVFELLSD